MIFLILEFDQNLNPKEEMRFSEPDEWYVCCNIAIWGTDQKDVFIAVTSAEDFQGCFSRGINCGPNSLYAS